MAPKKLSVDTKEIVSPIERPDSSTRMYSGKTRSIGSAESIATHLIEITPKELTFNNIEQNKREEGFITIRNLSKHPKRIRF